MVPARMENSDLSGSPELLDLLSDARRKQLSSEPGELVRIQDLLAFSETHQAESTVPPSSLCLLQDRLEGKCCRAEVSSEKSSSALPHLDELHSGVSESLDVLESCEQPLELLKSLRSQDKCNSDSAQALFWAGILQAQMCVLDLQGEIDKQKEPPKTSAMSAKRMLVTGMSLDSRTTHEPLLPDNDSAEAPENLEKKEEEESGEEEEEEEVENFFFNNPLFQESPHLTRTFEVQVPLDYPEREASIENCKEIFKRGLDSRSYDRDLFCHTNVAVKSVALNPLPIYEPDDNKDMSPCSFPSYMPHYRSLSPLMITEGDLEDSCSLAENTKDQNCFLDPIHRGVLESIAPGADLPGFCPAEELPGCSPAEEELPGSSPAEELPGCSPAQELSGSSPAEELPGSSPAEELPGSSPAEELPGSSPAEELSGSSPAEELPGSSPAEELPGSSPAEELPGSFPAEELPGSSPAEELPASSPAEELPGSSPAEELPASSPAEELPGSSPAEELPGSSPAEELPGSSPAEELPGSSPAEELSGSSPAEELPGSFLAEELPGSSPADELPGSSQAEELPGSSPAEELPESSPAEGLLFSAYSTCLMSALLQECPEIGPSRKPPSPGEIPSSFQVLSDPIAECSLQQERFGPPAPSHGYHSSSCPWVEEPEITSCLQKEVAAGTAGLWDEYKTDISHLSILLRGVEQNQVSSVEQLRKVELPAIQNNERLEDKEEELILRCPAEFPREPGGPGESLPATGRAEPNGNLLFANGTSGDQAAACRLATHLFHLDGFKRSQVAAFLQKNNAFSQMVAEAYLSFFHFSGQSLDQALRSFLKAFVLTGETQEQERILMHFSQRYHCCNPEASLTPDAVHTLACALMLLNADLHGQNIGRNMSCQDFISNLTALNEGKDFPKELLKALYNSIRHEKLEWAMDMEEMLSTKMSPNAASTPGKSSPFLTVLQDPEAKIYLQGLLARKVHAEADGKKTPWGKRGWKVFHAVLKGMVLYFLKDENSLEVSGSEDCIGVHHALAEKASKYTKRPHVFRLQTADWSIFLFQAPTSEEMTSWISRINLLAAMFSAPPFPAAVGSQKRFSRPVLPTAPSKNSLEEQHLAHEACMDRVSHELLELQRNLPGKRGRGRDLEEYQLRKEYLLYEKRRYEMYVKVLEVKLGCPTEDWEQWETRLAEVVESCLSLQKSHSSPSLNIEGPPPGGGRVKRNISERRTVRRIIPKRNKHLL